MAAYGVQPTFLLTHSEIISTNNAVFVTSSAKRAIFVNPDYSM
jgi:hypothetical protein